MNCHGLYIKNLLYKSKDIYNNYNIYYISYVDKIMQNNYTLSDDELELIKNSDITIIQYIKKNRGELNHQNIISQCNNSIIFLLPHYVFSGYFYDHIKIDCADNVNDVESLNNYLRTAKFDEKDCINFLNNELEYIRKLDKYSNFLNMYDFVKNNYQYKKLFQNRGHPRELFFVEIVNQFLNILGFKKIVCNDNGTYHGNQYSIIHDEVKKTLNLKFDTSIYSNDTYISKKEYYQIIFYENIFPNPIKEKLDKILLHIPSKYKGTKSIMNHIIFDDLDSVLKIIREE